MAVDVRACRVIASRQPGCVRHHGWTGYPLGVSDAERKNALLADAIVGGYRQAVSDLLAAAGIVEEVA